MNNRMITILLEILRNSNNFYVDLLYAQNGYQRTLNLEMTFHVIRVGYAHKILLVETVVIKNPHLHQNNHRKCQKFDDVENLILT